MTKLKAFPKYLFSALLVGCSVAATASAASLDNYPERPVRLIVPFTAGGNTDNGARLLAEGLSKELGQSVIVENKTGAGSIVGTEEAARSKPDGYTFLVTTIAFALNPSLHESLSYDSKNDFAPVAMVAMTPMILLTHPSVPAKTIPELVDYINSNDNVPYGSAGTGSAMHLAGELFRFETSTNATHIPYRGESAALVDLIAGHTSYQFGGASSSLQHIKAGSINAIAYASEERSPLLPEVPTSAEAGLPGFHAYTWISVLAPAGTPDGIIEKVNTAVNTVLAGDDVQQKLIAQGMEPISDSTPESTTEFIDDEISKWAELIKEIDMKTE